MSEPTDQEFLRSIFLMEAWDSLAVIEEGLGRLAAGIEPAWDELALVTHRLKGAASLHGFRRAAGLADGVEHALQPLAQATWSVRQAAVGELTGLLGGLKSVLEAIEQHRSEEMAASAPVPIPAVPALALAPAAADPVRAELTRFFAEGDEVLAYFGPEATEHLDAMTGALLALERGGDRDTEVAALFRAVHTLKGAAYVVGCHPIGDLAHGLEDLLVAVRSGQALLTPGAIGAGFEAVEIFKRMLEPRSSVSTDLTKAVQRISERVAALLRAPAALPTPAVESTPVMPATPPLPRRPAPPAPPHSRPTEREAPGRRSWQTIRVALERLDGLMDLVGELVVTRGALERRLGELDRLGEVLFASRARLSQAVSDVERRRLDERHAARLDAGHRAETRPTPGRSTSELFAELEFDRYDDFSLVARSVAEIASDVAEVQAEMASLSRTMREELGAVHRLTGEVRAGLGRARLVPIGSLYTRFVRQGQEAARAVGKSVRIETSGESVELDASIIEQIVDPLLHLVQNAVVHGLETSAERLASNKPAAGEVTLSACHRGAFVVVEVADDGRGIDAEQLKRQAVAQGFLGAEAAAVLGPRDALELIFRPGFSTAAEVTRVAGRGVGLDVVRTNVGRLNGEIDVDTVPGSGTRFTLRLPLTMLVTEAILVRVSSEVLAVPLNSVHVITPLAQINRRLEVDGEQVFVEGRWLPLLHLDRALGLPPVPVEGPSSLVLRGGAGLFGCAVSQVLHREEIVVKPLGSFLDGVGPYGGASIAADGRVTLLLDPVRLGDLARGPRPVPIEADTTSIAAHIAHTEDGRGRPHGGRGPLGKGNVLLVDDSISVRKFVGQMLEKAGFEVTTAIDGTEALSRLEERQFDVMVTDLEMPRLNGYELLEDVCRRPAARELPIVVLSTRSGAKHQSLARRLGVSHYVTKPVTEEAFVRLIESLALPGGAEARP
jgi:chemosensory pili system protein ChpA (sensor histidine kinase/response regulator)